MTVRKMRDVAEAAPSYAPRLHPDNLRSALELSDLCYPARAEAYAQRCSPIPLDRRSKGSTAMVIINAEPR